MELPLVGGWVAVFPLCRNIVFFYMVLSGLIIFIDLENKIFGKRNDAIDYANQYVLFALINY